ncbi:MAG TPA: DUF3679 domain-containing protein [Bacillales bacterium]|nr:DUF3679 domain-containing protein [Bacillales bacterium]
MARFTIKCFLLASLFFFGVILGMQKANEGIHDVKGLDHMPKIEQPSDNAPANVGIAAKREKLEDIQTFNIFSAAGDVASGAVTGLFRIGVDTTAAILQRLLS